MAGEPFVWPLALSSDGDNFGGYERSVAAWQLESLRVQQPYAGKLDMPDELKELVGYLPRNLDQQRPIQFVSNFFFCGYSVGNNQKIFFCGQCGFSRDRRNVVEKHGYSGFHSADTRTERLDMGVILDNYKRQKLRENARNYRARVRQSVLEERRRLEAEQSNAGNNPPPGPSPNA